MRANMLGDHGNISKSSGISIAVPGSTVGSADVVVLPRLFRMLDGDATGVLVVPVP